MAVLRGQPILTVALPAGRWQQHIETETLSNPSPPSLFRPFPIENLPRPDDCNAAAKRPSASPNSTQLNSNLAHNPGDLSQSCHRFVRILLLSARQRGGEFNVLARLAATAWKGGGQSDPHEECYHYRRWQSCQKNPPEGAPLPKRTLLA